MQQIGLVGPTGPTGPTGQRGPVGPAAQKGNLPSAEGGVSVATNNSGSFSTGYSPASTALFSVMAWVLSYNGGQNCRIIANQQADTNPNGFEFGTNMNSADNSGMQIIVGNNTGGSFYRANDPNGGGSLGSWTCMVAVANGTDLLLYHNGVQVGSTAMTQEVIAANAITVGEGWGGGNWNGRLAHLAVWEGTALTPAQVADLTSLAGPGQTISAYIAYVESLSPTLYYPLQETSGSTATNEGSTGSANNGTWGGSFTLNVAGGPVDGYNVFATGPPPATSVTLTSGTVYQNPNPWDVMLRVPVTYSPTSTSAATLAVGVGATDAPTQVTTHSEPAGALTGTEETAVIYVPGKWYALVTATNATLGTALAVPV